MFEILIWFNYVCSGCQTAWYTVGTNLLAKELFTTTLLALGDAERNQLPVLVLDVPEMLSIAQLRRCLRLNSTTSGNLSTFFGSTSGFP